MKEKEKQVTVKQFYQFWLQERAGIPIQPLMTDNAMIDDDMENIIHDKYLTI